MSDPKSLEHGIRRMRRAGTPPTTVRELMVELAKFGPDVPVKIDSSCAVDGQPTNVEQDDWGAVIIS
jgi:hypothetical protein